MGQSWYIVSPSAIEVLDFGGKLGEILFDGSARCLVMLLAVHVPPSELTQHLGTVEDNGEVAHRDSRPVKRQRESDINEVSTEQRQAKTIKVSDTSETAQIRPTFSGLPAEVHGLIFKEMGIGPMLSLSFTNQYFWSTGQKYIQKFFLSLLGPWAGESIVCVGQDIEAGDYPPSMFMEAKERHVYHVNCHHNDSNQKSSSELPQVLNGDRNGCQGTKLNLFDFASVECKEVKSDVSFPPLLGQVLLSQLCEDYNQMPVSLRGQVALALQPRLSEFYPEDQPWILRNLTTHEYVRSEAIALEPEHIHGPNIDHLGFGEVILSRVCWSTSSTVSMNYEGDLHRGVWAGHRFDITTLARHVKDTKESIWEDVSLKVAAEIASIWESGYGSDWRQIVCENGRRS